MIVVVDHSMSGTSPRNRPSPGDVRPKKKKMKTNSCFVFFLVSSLKRFAISLWLLVALRSLMVTFLLRLQLAIVSMVWLLSIVTNAEYLITLNNGMYVECDMVLLMVKNDTQQQLAPS
mmetsp:Transcript_26119/g.62054  ORF Transcript_26119/g.62054 Transcript_26119/m.62054 type:complete len:118 (-) Transcript_26119:72-425(-)